jgi:hypothetical protein
MIKLAPEAVTTSTAVFNGVSKVTTTDTLFVSYVELGFESGTVTAMIQRGTVVDGTFTANMSQLRVDVSTDGTFRSQDGTWSGTITNWTATLASLRAPFDGLIIGAGLVQGTAV